ncbi:hypothetical protein SAMN02910289_00380 [Lachnospiraceae bacterium RM5]|nr:hypothetical protein SAMN02910289_00380 [Lachnospiraceae bacterium RM5]
MEKCRSLNYQIKYKNDLDILDKSSINQYIISDHFVKRGYENLYVSNNGKIETIITFEDYLNKEIIEGLNRDFVQKSDDFFDGKKIEHFFIDNPDIDRVSVVENGKLICEIDSMIELPLQNGIAKNLMSLRYIDLFKEKLKDFFKKYQKILLIADRVTADFIERKLQEVSFDLAENIEKVKKEHLDEKYDVVIDLKYCNNIRKILDYNPKNLISLSKIMLRFAIQLLKSYCDEKGILVRFYKIPKYYDMTCMTVNENKNVLNRVKTGKLIKDGKYFSEYKATYKEIEFIQNRMYHASFRLDDGYCFIQDDCNERGIKVQDKIRSTGNVVLENENTQHIFFYGPCTTFGFLVPDNLTIPALVENKAIKEGKNIIIENRAGIHGYNELNAIMTALNTPIKAGDILIFLDALDDMEFSEYPNAQNTAEWFNREKDCKTTMFFDFPGHCSYKANVIFANNIYMDIKKYIDVLYLCNEERRKYCLFDFDRIKYMRETHSSCINFFMNYEKKLFSYESYRKIGTIILSDEFDSKKCFKIVHEAKKYCDILYVFKFNINLAKVDLCREFYENFYNEFQNNDVKLFLLDRFYYSKRYLYRTKNISKFLFIEKALLFSIFKRININIRFLIEDENSIANQYIEKLFLNEGVECIYI